MSSYFSLFIDLDFNNKKLMEVECAHINIKITVDTDKLIYHYIRKNPSKHQETPTHLGMGYQYMVVSNGPKLKGHSSGRVKFNGIVGNSIAFYATSESNNFGYPLFIYDIKKVSGDDVFGDFSLKTFNKEGIQPNVKDVTKTSWADATFENFQSDIISSGKEKAYICFAVFWVCEGKNVPELFGCFCVDLNITVVD